MRSAIAIFVLLCAIPGRAQQPDLYDMNTFRTIELTFSQTDWWNQLVTNHGTGTYISADLTVDGTVYPNVGVRFRGHSSYNWAVFTNSQKRPFKIKMDAFSPTQRLYDRKSLNLSNSYRDPTFMREPLCYHIYRQFMPAGGCNWVKLVINGQNWGVYVNVEQIDKNYMGRWFRDNDGNRYEADDLTPGAVPDSSALVWMGPNVTTYQNNYELKNENPVNPWVDLVDLIDKLNNEPLPTVLDQLKDRLDVDAAMMYLALCGTLCNPDTYIGNGNNFWVCHDDHHSRFHVLPWGLNATIGASPQAGLDPADRATWDIFFHENDPNRPLASRLFQTTQARQTYLAHVRAVSEAWLDWNTVLPLIQQWQSLIAAEVAADTMKLYTQAGFTSNLTTTYWWGDDEYFTGLQEIFDGRSVYLAGHPEVSQPAPQVSLVSHAPQTPDSTETVWVTATVTGPAAPVGAVTLHHRVLGWFLAQPMFDDGLHQDGAAGDGVYGASIPAQAAGLTVEYYVQAETVAVAGGAYTFSPSTGSFQAYSYQVQVDLTPGSVRINEFAADNDNLIADEFGEFDDFVELINTDVAPVDLGGRFLTDNLLAPMKWQFPTPTIVPPGGTVLVWCDNTVLQGPLHAAFKLGAAGETIALIDTDGTTVLDALVFGPQLTDVTTGRLFDGGEPWVTHLDPTPDALNEQACGLRRYAGLDPTVHEMTLDISGTPSIGEFVTIEVRDGMPNQVCFVFGSVAPQYLSLASSGLDDILLITQDTVGLWVFPFNALGALDITLFVPNVPSLPGLAGYLQSFGVDATTFATESSNAIEMKICP